MTKSILININCETTSDEILLKNAIQNICNKANKETLLFLSELANKQGINEKIAKNKTAIKLAL